MRCCILNRSSIRELVPVLTALATNHQTTPPRLLIIANKADLLVSSSTTDTNTPAIPAKTRQLALDRLQSLLQRELTRIKSSRLTTSSSRIEGIDKVPSGSPASLITLVKRFFTGGAVEEKEMQEDGEAVWGGPGAFEFGDVDRVEVDFAVGSAIRDGGLDEVRAWLEGL